ncbi:cell wall-binding repeat-containing protein [Candidatus Poriferisodalis sp.]|uniref:cell wall-binding repeat-containing protein n=1 Tax=Candidatus Poriferisodalis sp. TaxID=3101277 RepID=UPI003B01175C
MPSDLAGGAEVVRYTGSDPYELSLAVAQALVDAEGGTSEWVVLASGESWADAATAGPLAASLGAPVVLVPPGDLQAAGARLELVKFLRSSSVRRVVIVGSSDVLPNHESSVLFGLGMLPRNIESIYGDDLVGSAIAVAERIGTPPELGELGRTAIIASNQSIADAVAVGPLAAAGPFPLLLTAPDELDPRITAYLEEREIEHVVLVGGTNAIAPAIRKAIDIAGATATRLAGEDRYHTAALAMDLLAEVPRCTEDAIDNIGLAPAGEPLLALTAGRLLGPQCIPLLFTDADRLALVTQNHLYLYRSRTGIKPGWHLVGNSVSVDSSAIERPPVRMATVADNPDGDGQHIVVLDEHHNPTRYLLDAGFDGITGVEWTTNRSALAFTGVREGTRIPYAHWVDRGRYVTREGVGDGARGMYELDLRSGIARPRPRFPTWYEHLVQDHWVDPMPSVDRAYIVFRAPTEDFAGHSLFALDVESGEVRQLTHNNTNDTHHVVSSDWLSGGQRLIYAHLDISQIEEPSPKDGPSNAHAYARPDTRQFGSKCGNVPLRRAHIVNVEDGLVRPLPHGNHLIDEPIVPSPDGRFVAIKSYEDYELTPERDLYGYFRWRCTHDGIGIPSISVLDLRGSEPQTVNENTTSGFTPTWSPDSKYLMFRAPTEGHEGHSLFAVDVSTGEATRFTHNQSNEHHHVAQEWLLNGSKLLYTVQSIEELEGPCHHVSPAQGRRRGVPHVEAHVLDVSNRHSAQLAYEGLIINRYYDAAFSLSPNETHVALVSSPSYEYYTAQGGCSYLSRGAYQMYVFDISTAQPRQVVIDGDSAAGTLWSPDGRYLAFWQRKNSGSSVSHFVLDTQDGSVRSIHFPDTYQTQARLHRVAWAPDSSRVLYELERGSYGNRTYLSVVAEVETPLIVKLQMTADSPHRLPFHGFSTDGRAVIQGTGYGGTAAARGLLVHDIVTGTFLGTYHIYAATEPGKPVLDNPGDIGDVNNYFRFSAQWTTTGIHATGEYYLAHSYDY